MYFNKNKSEQVHKMAIHKTKLSIGIEKYMLVNLITINDKTEINMYKESVYISAFIILKCLFPY